MARILINDLEERIELDRTAMVQIRGGDLRRTPRGMVYVHNRLWKTVYGPSAFYTPVRLAR